MTLITLHLIHHALYTGLAYSSECQTPAQNHRTAACALFSTQNVLDLPMDELALPQDSAWTWSIFQSLPEETILSETASTRFLSLSSHVNRFPFVPKYLPLDELIPPSLTHYLPACPTRIQCHPWWWNTLSGSLLSLMNLVYCRSLVSTLFSNQWQEPLC